MTATGWKAFERWHGKRWGGERVPVTGRVRGYAPDVMHPAFAIEDKTRKVIPAWLWEALDQADKAAEFEAARGNSKSPIALIHQDRTPYAASIVIQRLPAWEEIAVKAGLLTVVE